MAAVIYKGVPKIESLRTTQLLYQRVSSELKAQKVDFFIQEGKVLIHIGHNR
jgi:hypothetical protein